VFFPGKAEVYDALLIKYGIGSAKDLIFQSIKKYYGRTDAFEAFPALFQ
jgi:hypothetical protein